MSPDATPTPDAQVPATLDAAQLPAPKYDDDLFDSLSSSKFLPRVQLIGGSSDLAKKEKVPQGTYAMIRGTDKDNPVTLGKEVDVLVLSWRPMALDTQNENGPISCFKVESEIFKQISDRSETKDSGCMYGMQFLLYLADQKEFVTFFMGSKSARREAPNLKARMQKPATLKVQLITTKKYSWHNPSIVPCSTPFDLPDIKDIQDQIEVFNNPPDTEVEAAEEVKQGEERAR